jgi:hypothetical protein
MRPLVRAIVNFSFMVTTALRYRWRSNASKSASIDLA